MTNQKNPLVKREEKIQKFWEDNKIFEKTLAQTKGHEAYSFYDGPPFATGLPHYGHLVASLMKDVVPRYQTMKGKYVKRVWGWDCHGLPIENIVEKELGFKFKKDIEKYGIDKFNATCRSKVLAYADEWRKIIPRFGRWVDMKNAYMTMDLKYMESVWWVFKELWDKDLIYEGYKSMHVCPRCETTLSQQEVAEGYKNIKDISVTVKFELVGPIRTNDSDELTSNGASEPGTFILAWTTTPWTLPGNVALAVGKDIEYVKIKKENDILILAKDRLSTIDGDFKILDEFKGKELVGKKYKPLFDYYLNANLANKENLYTIVSADFVSTEDGTGVVHIAPAFGEDDMNLGKEKSLPFIQHVTMGGIIKDEVKDFAGLSVKPIDDHGSTDIKILKYLADKRLLFSKEKYEHSYPHCWRCDTPLINYATSSWFVNVLKVKDEALKLAQKINWSPRHIKAGRFGKWLEGARDWSISRQRFWASVMPIWQCECGERQVFGSVNELEKASGQKVTDLHKDKLDQITFPCSKCKKEMHRIPDVLDTWFDSASMPYAQHHYPFENKDKVEDNFPAEFIAEGADQTRAWFYYLHIIATAIFDKPAYKNVIVNGIVLAEDGKKMAKKLQNYPEPREIIDKYGADALRFYLLSSPVMLAENFNFSEEGVKEAFQKVIMLTSNVLKFYKLYEDPSVNNQQSTINNQSVLDQWLLSKLNMMVKEATEAMESYNLPKAVRPIADFIDEFSTWWLRRSRDRFKVSGEDKQVALSVFKHTLLELSKVMAPFTPFVAEHIYGEAGGEKESVHLDAWPKADKVDDKLLEQMGQARKIVEMALAARAENGVKIRQPLNSLTVTGYDLPTEIAALVADEINVKKVDFKKGEDLKVELDTKITEELKVEGALRELVRAINSIRKKEKLTLGDEINVQWESQGKVVGQVMTNKVMIKELGQATITKEFKQQKNSGQEIDINGEKVNIKVMK